MYVSPNFKTKKLLKEAIVAGKKVTVYQPGPFGSGNMDNVKCAVEGPHYPEPHRWYAQVEVVDGYVTKVK